MPLDQPKSHAVNVPVDLAALSTHIDPREDIPEPMIPLEPSSERPLELLHLQPGLLPSINPGHGNGIGSGLGNETGNGLGAGLGQGRGSTWIHSARGDEELKVAVNFRDVHDYIPPEYPAEAVSEHISGVVILRVTIDTKGTPVKWTVIEGHPLLVAATLKVFPRWHFVPPVYQGEKVGATFEVGIRFTLK
ncbi:hypothetical protein GETHLI_30640 [Geothrix limicola]|uniref:TonB C-terminal domain-containing protein n=2 Tax=Geothrix limicola TaxID=2927978 RepID=A0ABQ5QIN6_9BACT|nr:hypothetical protein GETHLI_30640 [Geothrix limicola]